MQKLFLARQGDVLIRQVATIPAAAKPEKRKGRIVLAYGETTGHAHAIAERGVKAYTMEDAGAAVRRFLEVAKGATVRHEEHAPIPLPPGCYEVVQQVEYSPEAVRAVQD